MDFFDFRDAIAYLKSKTRLYEPNDAEDEKELAEFVKIYDCQEEAQRRKTARSAFFEQGYQEGLLDTELPVVGFFDSGERLVSWEIYQGRLPRRLMEKKWHPIIRAANR